MKCKTKDELLKVLLFIDSDNKIQLGVNEMIEVDEEITEKLKEELLLVLGE